MNNYYDTAIKTLENLGYIHTPGAELWKHPLGKAIMPEVEAVYTQAMADDGVMPSVGMSCMVYCNEIYGRYNDFFDVEIKILAVTNGVFTFSNPLFGCAAILLDIKMVKPLTPPIELIDGEYYQFTSPSLIIRKGYYIPVKGLFVCHDGNIDADRCTNIQLLEVK